NFDLASPAVLWVEAEWGNLTPTATFGLKVAGISSNGSVSFLPPETGLVYLGAAPATLRVDGAFGDWRGRPYGQDILGDVTNRTRAPQYDANVDLLATAVDVGANFTGYVRVDGRHLDFDGVAVGRPGPPLWIRLCDRGDRAERRRQLEWPLRVRARASEPVDPRAADCRGVGRTPDGVRRERDGPQSDRRIPGRLL